MISGPSGLLGIDGAKTKLAEIKLIDEKVDHPNRIVLGDIVFQLNRKHRCLTTIRPAYEAAHPIPRILAGGFSSRISIQKRTFHTSSAKNGPLCRYRKVSASGG